MATSSNIPLDWEYLDRNAPNLMEEGPVGTAPLSSINPLQSNMGTTSTRRGAAIGGTVGSPGYVPAYVPVGPQLPQKKVADPLEGLKSLINGGGSAAGSGALSGSASGGSATLPGQVAFPNAQAGVDAAFARGKDKAALNARASLTGLTEALGSRNMLGGSTESQGIGEVVGRAGQGVNELIREQTVQDANLANDRAKLEYQGKIQQRGQDINAAQEQARQRQSSLNSLLSLVYPNGYIY
jgi:hypothetical protein